MPYDANEECLPARVDPKVSPSTIHVCRARGSRPPFRTFAKRTTHEGCNKTLYRYTLFATNTFLFEPLVSALEQSRAQALGQVDSSFMSQPARVGRTRGRSQSFRSLDWAIWIDLNPPNPDYTSVASIISIERARHSPIPPNRCVRRL